MTLTRVYWVLLAIAIAAILMASFLLRWGVLEPQKRKTTEVKPPPAAAPVPATAVTAAKAPDPFLNKAPILSLGAGASTGAGVAAGGAGAAGAASTGGSSARLAAFLRSREGATDNAKLAEFARALNSSELGEAADRALSLAHSVDDRKLAARLLARAGTIDAIDPIRRVLTAKLPPGASYGTLEEERGIRTEALAGFANYRRGTSGAAEAEAAMTEAAQAITDRILGARLAELRGAMRAGDAGETHVEERAVEPAASVQISEPEMPAEESAPSPAETEL